MKKIISIFILIVLVATGAFSEKMFSIGGGALLEYSGNNGVKADKPGFMEGYIGYRNLSIGGYVFFDVTYAELDISFAYGTLYNVSDCDFKDPNISNDYSGSMTQFGFSLLGKYPIDVSGFTFYPILGFNYNRVFTAKNDDGGYFYGQESYRSSYLRQIGLLGGAGFDFPLTGSLYLQSEAMFQFRFPSKFMKDLLDSVFDGEGNATFGVGPRIKVGLGYRF